MKLFPCEMASPLALQLVVGLVWLLVAMASKLDGAAVQAVQLTSQSHNALPPCPTWCVCKEGPESVLQKTLDYACGHGADCNPIKPNGACFNPDSVRAHCSYAVNSYFHKMNKAGATCDFSTTATLTASDPSSSGCSYPAAFASSSGSATPVPAAPKTTPTTPRTPPTSGNTPTFSPPYTATPTPPTGYLGGGMGPPGMGVYDDNKALVLTLPITSVALCPLISVLALNLWK